MSQSPPHNKTALITGASSGIGEALAWQFAAGGYNVILAARTATRLAALASELTSRHGITATAISADLETEEGARRLAEDVRGRGLVISALVNNAGYAAFGEFQHSDLATELASMRLNMTAVVVLTNSFCLIFWPPAAKFSTPRPPPRFSLGRIWRCIMRPRLSY